MAKKIMGGTVYCNSIPEKPGYVHDTGAISLGDTVPGKEIHWILTEGKLIANQCICMNVSWTMLNMHGFTFGRPVIISGKRYLCRCPRLGMRPNLPNEWDILLDKNSMWQTGQEWFWGQDIVPGKHSGEQDLRAMHGRAHDSWHYAPGTTRNETTGFRPILEPLLQLSDNLTPFVGHEIELYSEKGFVARGKLVQADDYDLVLEDVPFMQASWRWSSKEGTQWIINRIVPLWRKGSFEI